MWTKTSVAQLIKLYEKHENLYNARHKDYKDRAKRTKSLFTICERLKKKNPTITIEDVKNKMHTIRTQYSKEVRLINESKIRAAGPDDIHEPKLWFYPLTRFLDSHAQTRFSSLSLSLDLKKDENGSDQTESLNNYIHPSPFSRSTMDSNDSANDENACDQSEEEMELEGNYVEVSESSTSEDIRKSLLTLQDQMDELKRLVALRMSEKIEYEWLGSQVVCEINNIKDEDIRRDTAWNIQSTLRKAILDDVAGRDKS